MTKNGVQNKTLFLAVSSRPKINFILRTDLLRLLKERFQRVVIISPFGAEDFFRREFGESGIFFEVLRGGGKSAASVLNNLRNLSFSVDNDDIRAERQILSRAKRRFDSFAARRGLFLQKIVLAFLPPFLKRSHGFWNLMDRIMVRDNYYDNLFRKYRPAAALVDSPAMSKFLAYCQRYNVPITLADINFDALTSRFSYDFRPIFRRIAMTGGIMQSQAINLNKLAEKKLPLIGSIRYDHYFAKRYPLISRNEFFKEIGADPQKKLISFATVDPLFFPQNADIIRMILDAIKNRYFAHPVQLLVSCGLGNDKKIPYRDLFRGGKNLILLTIDERPHKDFLTNLLRYSDVTVSVGSTFALESCAVDTPAIWIGFDGFTNYPDQKDSIRHIYNVRYLKACLDFGGIKLVENQNDLIKTINLYLGNPTLHKNERNRTINALFFKPDGNAARRLAALVDETTANDKPQPPIQCGVCETAGSFLFLEKFKEFCLWQCALCHGQFWTPMKSPGAAWYEADERYSFRNKNPLKTPEHDHREFLKERVKNNSAEKKPALLDIGMGTGNFLAAAEKRGYDVYGIDFDEDAVRSAGKNFGLKNVHATDIGGALAIFGNNFFDAAAMFQVLEHLERPSEFIGKARELLRPGGCLAISVPYRGFWDKMKPGDKPPRHLTRWDEISIKNFLETNGFKIVKIKKLPAPFKYLIKRFHFWTVGVLSFGTVAKIAKKAEVSEKISRARAAKAVLGLAKIKDYILFSVPAVFLYAFLFAARRHYLDLYVLAEKK